MKRNFAWHGPVDLVPTAMLFFTVFLPLVYSSGQLSISVWQCCVLFLLPVLFVKKYVARDNGAFFWFSVFLLALVAVLQPLVVGSGGLVFKSWLLYISQIFVFALLAFGYTRGHLFVLFSRFVLISAALVAIVIILQFVTVSTVGNPRSYFGEDNPPSTWVFLGTEFIRPLGTLDNPNTSGALLLISLPFVFYFYGIYRESRFLVTALIIIIAILLTMSRGVILGLAVLMLSFFLGRYGWLFKRVVGSRLGWLISMILIPAFFILFVSGGYWGPIAARFEMLFGSTDGGEYLTQGVVSFRLLMIRIGILAGLDHPFFGVGLGGSAHILTDYSSLVPEWWQHRLHAFVPVFFAEAGAVSGVIWLLLQLAALYRGFKCVRFGGDSYARAIFAANVIGFYLSWFYMTVYTVEFGAIYFIILLLGIKSRSVRSGARILTP